MVTGVVAGCLAPVGCASVRPLELAPPDRVAQTSLVLDAKGRRLAALRGPEDRTAVPLSKVSRWMRLAVVDTEDARFWRHGGVDWLAVARAAATPGRGVALRSRPGEPSPPPPARCGYGSTTGLPTAHHDQLTDAGGARPGSPSLAPTMAQALR